MERQNCYYDYCNACNPYDWKPCLQNIDVNNAPCTICPSGRQGARGPIGPQGPQGVQGETGPIGPQGA